MLLYNELQNEIILNSKKEFVLMCEYMKQIHVEGDEYKRQVYVSIGCEKYYGQGGVYFLYLV